MLSVDPPLFVAVELPLAIDGFGLWLMLCEPWQVEPTAANDVVRTFDLLVLVTAPSVVTTVWL